MSETGQSLHLQSDVHVVELGDQENLRSIVLLSPCPFFRVHFQPLDITEPHAINAVPKDTKVFLFAYFLVEMLPFKAAFLNFFRSLVDKVGTATLFMSMDKVEPAVCIRSPAHPSDHAQHITVKWKFVRAILHHPTPVLSPQPPLLCVLTKWVAAQWFPLLLFSVSMHCL